MDFTASNLSTYHELLWRTDFWVCKLQKLWKEYRPILDFAWKRKFLHFFDPCFATAELGEKRLFCQAGQVTVRRGLADDQMAVQPKA
jgi:hypothetical protein